MGEWLIKRYVYKHSFGRFIN